MGDRMFASEGDSVHAGRPPSSWEDRWNSSPPRGTDTGRVGDPRQAGIQDGSAGDDAAAGVVRRLQSRVDRHRWLLERMQSDPLQPEPAGLPELLDTVRRMRRDTESLLILQGQHPGVAPGARRLSDVLAAAAAASEEPGRVDVRTAPSATVSPAGATELLHVLAEVIDHVTAVYPGARVDVTCRAEAPGGVAVEVRADGATRHDPEGLGGRRALVAAQRLAQRSLSGIVLRTPAVGVTASGPVASIHCPGSVVSIDPTRVDPTRVDPTRVDPVARDTAAVDPQAHEPGRALASWSSQRRRAPVEPPAPDPLADDPLFSGPLPLERLLAEPTQLEPTPLDHEPSSRPHVNGNGRGVNGNGNGNGGVVRASAPAYAPSAGSGVDELFGPMLDLAHDPAEDHGATPIFEAIASAWFREDEPTPGGAHRNGAGNGAGHRAGNGVVDGGNPERRGRHGGGSPRNGAADSPTSDSQASDSPTSNSQASGSQASGSRTSAPGTTAPRNWETPSDTEWRAAAERAARPEPEAQTPTGLPRRRPGNQLVPPPRGGRGVPEPEQPERVPDRVRDRLSTYQRGLRQGRHRADPAADPGDPAAW